MVFSMNSGQTSIDLQLPDYDSSTRESDSGHQEKIPGITLSVQDYYVATMRRIKAYLSKVSLVFRFQPKSLSQHSSILKSLPSAT